MWKPGKKKSVGDVIVCVAGREVDVKGSGVLRYTGPCLGFPVCSPRLSPLTLGLSKYIPLGGPSEGARRGPVTVGH